MRSSPGGGQPDRSVRAHAALAAAAILAVAGLRAAFVPEHGGFSPFFGYSAAIAAAAWLGGWRVGLGATLGAAAVASSLADAAYRSAPASFGLRALLFLIEGVLVTFVTSELRAARTRLRSAVARASRSEAEQVRSEAAASAALAELESIYQGGDVGLCQLDRSLRFVRVNARLAQMNGVPVEEHLGRRVEEVVPELARVVTPHFERILATGEPVIDHEVSSETPAEPGVRRWWRESWLPVRDERGRVGGIQVIVRDITDEKRAAEALQLSEQRLRSAIESSGVAVWDHRGDETWWSSSHFSVLGLAPGAVAPGTEAWLRHVHPDDLAHTLAALEAARESGEYRCEHRVVTAGGAVRWLSAHGRIVQEADGRERFFGAALDVTAEHEAERRYQTLVESLPDVVFRLDRGLRHRYVSGAAERFWGIPAASFLGRTAREIGLRGEACDALDAAARRALAGEPQEVEWREGDRVARSRLVPERSETGEVTGLLGVTEDVTEQRRALDALRDRELRLRVALDAAELGAWEYLPETGEVRRDARADRQYGTSGGVTRFEDDLVRVHPDDRALVAGGIARLLAGEESGPVHAEYRVLQPDGSERWLLSYGRAHHEGEGASRRVVRISGVNQDVTERKQAEAALARSEERFRLAADAVNGIIYDFDLRTKTVERTRGLEEVTGWKLHEVPRDASWWHRQIHPDDLARLAAEPPQTGDGRLVHHYRVRHRDGRWVHVVDRSIVLRDGSGHALRQVGCTMDVSEQVAAQEALRRSEERFRSLAEGMPHLVWESDAEGRCIWLNPTWHAYVGSAPGSGLGEAWLESFHPDDRAPLRACWEKAVTDPDAVRFDAEWRLRRHDGVYRWFRVAASPVRDADRRVVRWAGICTDVDDQRHAADALAERAARLVGLTEAVEDVAWVSEPEVPRVVFVSAGYERLFGRPLSQIHENFYSWIEAIHPDDRPEVVRRHREALHTGGLYEAEYRTVHPDGSVRWVRDRGRRIPGTVPRRMAGIAIDVTERRSAEEALREADRRKDEFLAMLAHELRNPLAPIRNAIELLGDAGSADETRFALQILDRQATQLTRIVDDLLDVSRIVQGRIHLELGRLALDDVARAAIETVQPIVERKEQRVHLQGDETLRVRGDRTRLVQVVANLLANAAKFTPPRGSIHVTVARRGAEGEIRVRDSGIGIEPEARERIFQLFVQEDSDLARTQGGLGIGLALGRRLVQMHGGTLTVESEGRGRGAEFRVALPAVAGETESTEPAERAGAGGREKLRILVIEDNPDAAETFALLLSRHGHDVRVAMRGAEGIAAFAEHAPAIGFVDLGLPDLDGFEVARRVRDTDAGRRCTLVALSGYGREEDRARAFEAGFDHHVTKPIEPAALLSLLAAAAKAGGERAGAAH